MTIHSAGTQDFTQGDVTKQMIRFAVPLFFSNLLQAVYNMVDMIVVGQYIGKNGLSAVAIGGDILNLLTFLAMGFSSAGQVIIAQNIGAGHRKIVGKVIGNLFVFLMASALLLSVLCFGFRMRMLSWMNTPAEVWENAYAYMTISIAGLVFIYGYNAVGAVLRGMGDSWHPFLFIACAAILNLFLDLLFVVGFHWAAGGAALATVIGQGVSFAWGLVFLLRQRKNRAFGFDRSCLRLEKDIMLPLLKLGFPMAVKSAAVTFSKLFVDSWINSYGVVASSISGIGTKMNMISNLFSNAVNNAVSTMTGQNIGAGKYDRVSLILKRAYLVVLAMAAVMSAVVVSAPSAIFRVFTSDGAVLEACGKIVPLLVMIFFGSAVRSPNNGLINGSGNYRLNFAVALFDGIINRIGFSLLLGLGTGLGWAGFLYGDALAGYTPFVIGTIYYFSGRWRTKSFLIKTEEADAQVPEPSVDPTCEPQG